MLSSGEHTLIYQKAYLPEHLPGYGEAVSGAEAHLHGNYLCFSRGTHLTFVGYPLEKEAQDVSSSYESACDRFRPSTVAIIAPELWFPVNAYENQKEDCYYRLELPLGPLDPEIVYMVRRAARELQVHQGRFGREHKKLVKEFLGGHELTQEHGLIFGRIPHYLKRSETARLLEARRGNTLVAFTVTDLGSANYAFYLFNFRSDKKNVPGASDLLFHEMVNLAQSAGKTALNLGLGIHPGIRHFKEKWGGIPFLPYKYAVINRKPIDLGTLEGKI